MRKKLILLGLALAAVAAAGAITPASADPCPKNSNLFVCPTYTFCCPFNARCACLPR
ncbi:MAG TPA: hypothetical protein VF173_16015 [Thermoanaerobaculia bacterium]|nr:hypothetical protein [Thermoanaerobaculia bacterium]